MNIKLFALEFSVSKFYYGDSALKENAIVQKLLSAWK